MSDTGTKHKTAGLRLQRPGPEHETAVSDYKAAFLAAGDSMDGTAGLRNAASYAEWLEKLDKNSSEDTVETGLVTATTFLALRQSDGCLVGMIDIRHRLSDYLLQHGGHIGYSVHPDERRKGYATAMLALALEYCARPAASGGLGLARVLVTCDADNTASARTIEANGGVLENRLPEDGRLTSRYWIDLSPGDAACAGPTRNRLAAKRSPKMAELKTRQSDADVGNFIDSFANTEQKRQDSYELIKLMSEITGCAPKLWGASMVGFGQYHYKSERSRQEGDWPLVGFSPRKAAISLYVYTGLPEHAWLLDKLGKFKMGKACIYVSKLADIDRSALELLIQTTIDFLKAKYG